MSLFTFKGTSISNIYVNDGTTSNTGFLNIPNSNSTDGVNYSSMRPNSFGYSYSGTDLCNSYTAKTTGILTYTQNVSIPTGATHCKIISVGGGGGSGGSGGVASSRAYNGARYATGGINTAVSVDNSQTTVTYLGTGGSGGYGEYNYTSINISGAKTIDVTVGNPGNAGTNGNDVYNRSNRNGSKGDYKYDVCTSVSNAGNDGTDGTSSYINISGTQYALSNGGVKGTCGNGGKAQAGESNAYGNINATIGSAGNSTTQQANDNSYKTLSTYGNPGTQGAVQIIWLYDL